MYYKLRVIDGVQCSELGIVLEANVRCSHGVVDGDKPIGQHGPRCAACLSKWSPVMKMRDYGRGSEEHAYCPTCGESLHITYSPASNRSQAYLPLCWSHNASSLGCPRATFPVDSYEERYNGYGWGQWTEHTEHLVREMHDSLERDSLYRERYNK